MNYLLVQHWLILKYEEIKTRTEVVLVQLNDEQLNWKPNEGSCSIANLIIHIRGNITERVSNGINNESLVRDRDSEFDNIYLTKEQIINIFRECFHELIETIKNLPEEVLFKTQTVRNKPRINLEILLQSACHFSEHMGQIFYIAKTLLDESYITTSIPRTL